MPLQMEPQKCILMGRQPLTRETATLGGHCSLVTASLDYYLSSFIAPAPQLFSFSHKCHVHACLLNLI